VQKFGKEQVNIWRRSYDVPPPDCDLDSEHYPANNAKYDHLPVAQKIRAESLKVKKIDLFSVSHINLFILIFLFIVVIICSSKCYIFKLLILDYYYCSQGCKKINFLTIQIN
jgi:hypothetical protein